MRIVIGGMVACFVVLGLPPAAQADDFMKECRVTMDQKTCDCISGRMAPDSRAAGTAGLRKSNEAMAPGGNLLDPATLPPFEMKGLNAVVVAQAYCM